MSHKDAFTAEEWTDVTLAPMLASFAVTAADPSGLVGMIRESSATGWAMKAAKEPAGTLMAEIVAAYDAFKAWVSATAQTVAEAGKEGGFLGFGGEKVSAAERKTLADIDTALGLPAA